MKVIRLFFSLAVFAVFAFSAVFEEPASLGAAQGLEPQTNTDGGVTVKVTPKNITAGNKTWDFEVSLATHTGDLGQDLARVSVLVDVEGKEHSPIGWEGDPPGGHHRKGVLRFKPFEEAPKTLELRITGIGGVDARVFRWTLK